MSVPHWLTERGYRPLMVGLLLCPSSWLLLDFVCYLESWVVIAQLTFHCMSCILWTSLCPVFSWSYTRPCGQPPSRWAAIPTSCPVGCFCGPCALGKEQGWGSTVSFPLRLKGSVSVPVFQVFLFLPFLLQGLYRRTEDWGSETRERWHH